MAVNVNQVGYERRLAVVKDILKSRGLQVSKISDVAYDEAYTYAFNNFFFKVELATPASSSIFTGKQHGTTAAPSDGVSVLVLKLSNPTAGGVNNTNRVENDVAVQHLVRQSMAEAGVEALVPVVYAWTPTTDAKAEEGFGWIMSELKHGVDLNTVFPSLPLEDKVPILEQFATVLKTIQTARIPDSAKMYGGLTFDSSGMIVSGQSSVYKSDPVATYAEFRLSKLRKQLELAAQSPVIQGWKSNGIAGRIEKFIASGGPEKLLAGADLGRMSIIHGDLTTHNMLFDTGTKRITAVLDFDFSFISHTLDEFISGSSLGDLGGMVDFNNKPLKDAILSGNFSTFPENLDKESTQRWQGAKAWNAAMKTVGVVSPSDMRGVQKICDLIELQILICPFDLGNQLMIDQMDDGKKAARREKTEADLVQWLDEHGF
ncbi:protein kinase-like domain [Pochonia chlamydosporia 170]|uniref:non-specific serine/threonine protein kinase n=1 Tax=Pochonia chlamydosporia 170 TaxID=1380566 RepID=A0A179F6J8_METCM|nr:protein kinase-like domain [Pochonia chlamydosporia 170]OAQ61058.1 protein kinase-like domain [Pochonia chlamydosporia 170]